MRVRFSRSFVAAAVAAVGLLVLVLWPLLRTGFIGDDLWNAYLYCRPGYGVRGMTLLDDIATWISSWWATGRFNPLSTYIAVVWYVVNRNAILYKAYLVAINVATVGLAAWFSRRISGSRTMGLTVLVVMAALFQFRVFEDPIVSYSGHPQVALIWTLLSWLALLRYLEKRRTMDLVLSLVTFACGVLTYEVVLPLVLVHFAMVWLHPARRRLAEVVRLGWPLAALAVAYAAFVVALRIFGDVPLAAEGSAAYVPRLEPVALLLTFARQTTAALPLMYRFTTGSELLGSVGAEIMAGAVTAAVLAALVIGLVVAVSRLSASETVEAEQPVRPGVLALVGLALFLLPGILTSLSPRYQDAISWGIGYLPVCISAIGVALMAAAALWWAMHLTMGRAARGLLIAVVAVALAGTVVVNYFDNRIVLRYQQAVWVEPTVILDNAAARGLFDEVPDGVSLYTGFDDVRFQPPGLYGTVGGVRLALTSSPTEEATSDPDGWRGAPAPGIWYSARSATGPGSGYALVGSIQDVEPAEGEAQRLSVTKLGVYVQRPETDSEAADAAFDSLGIDADRMRVESTGDGWELYRAEPGYVATLTAP